MRTLREIKFRGRADSGPNKGKWYFGFYWTNGIGNHFIRVTKDENGFCIYDIKVDPETIGQYTGLHDNTDDEVEIFEFDYVEFEYKGSTYKGLIKFEGGCFIIACNELPDSYIPMFEIAEFDRDYSWINGRVIGNKFDNPELMKESEDNEKL